MACDLARPKSATLGVPSAASRTLAGFRSRWTMPSRCASATPRASVSTSSAACRAGPGGAVEPAVEAAAVEVLQLEEGQAVGLADVVDLHDVGVLQPRDGLGLGQESDDRLGVGMGTGQDHLEGARAVEADLPGPVDDAHAAAAQLAQDLVALDDRDRPLSRSRRRRVGRRIAGSRGHHGLLAIRPDAAPAETGRFRRGRGIDFEDKVIGIGQIERQLARDGGCHARWGLAHELHRSTRALGPGRTMIDGAIESSPSAAVVGPVARFSPSKGPVASIIRSAASVYEGCLVAQPRHPRRLYHQRLSRNDINSLVIDGLFDPRRRKPGLPHGAIAMSRTLPACLATGYIGIPCRPPKARDRSHIRANNRRGRVGCAGRTPRGLRPRGPHSRLPR